jgi:hypothetical protein
MAVRRDVVRHNVSCPHSELMYYRYSSGKMYAEPLSDKKHMFWRMATLTQKMITFGIRILQNMNNGLYDQSVTKKNT